eukprot:3510364-Amphidinium_carterae.1
MDVDIACLQETRLRDTVTMDRVGEYSTYFTPASKYRGGLAFLVHDRNEKFQKAFLSSSTSPTSS